MFNIIKIFFHKLFGFMKVTEDKIDSIFNTAFKQFTKAEKKLQKTIGKLVDNVTSLQIREESIKEDLKNVTNKIEKTKGLIKTIDEKSNNISNFIQQFKTDKTNLNK